MKRMLVSICLLVGCTDGASTSPGCGDGKVDPGELCDGAGRLCSELGASYGDGTAACRASCDGWDTQSCQRVNGDNFEFVKPAERDPSRLSTARCNDGTPFALAVRLPANPSSDWFIYLEGGVFCDDASMDCSQREMRLTSTRGEADRTLGSIHGSGFLSSDPAVNPDFAAANQVYAYYCSSDFWSGTTTERRPSKGDPAQGWYFSGRSNVAALLSILTERYGLDDADPSLHVMWGGGSAGAHGAHFNSAVIAARLAKTQARGRIQLFADAGWMIDWDSSTKPILNTTGPDREIWRDALDYWGGALDPECEAQATDRIDCWFGAGWYPVVSARMPVFVQQCAVDGSFGLFLHELMVATPELMAWRTQSRSALSGVSWLFSGLSTPYHTLAGMDGGIAMGPAGSTLREMLGRFWHGAPPERIEF